MDYNINLNARCRWLSPPEVGLKRGLKRKKKKIYNLIYITDVKGKSHATHRKAYQAPSTKLPYTKLYSSARCFPLPLYTVLEEEAAVLVWVRGVDAPFLGVDGPGRPIVAAAWDLTISIIEERSRTRVGFLNCLGSGVCS